MTMQNNDTRLLSEDPEDLEDVQPTDEGAILLFEGHEEEALEALEATEAALAAGGALTGNFYDNLAEDMTGEDLSNIASDALEAIEFDLDSRSDWSATLADGIANLGLKPFSGTEDFVGACTAVYPMVSQAMVQFNARTMDEIYPPQGPVKTVLLGEKTQEKRDQARRVLDYMNYQVTEESLDWFQEDDIMTWWLGFEGSAFKTVYRDAVLGINTSKFVKASDFIVPYNATDLDTASRFAERLKHQDAMEVRRQVDAGVYLEVELSDPSGAESETELDDEISDLDGRDSPSMPDEDREYTIYKAHVYLQLEGDETDLPYMLYVEKDSRTVLGIYRDWLEDSATKRREESYVHYKLVPGFGFYGLGYLHLLGNIGNATTDAMRFLINAGYYASAQGGFTSRDVFPQGVALELKPGVYQSTDATPEELEKAFYTPSFKDPSVALFQTLNMLIDSGKEFASITEAMTGSAASTGPVGTIVALIEQGSKVYSGIHKRIHQAKRREYNILFRLNSEHVPPDGYPYRVEDDSAVIYSEDFDGKIGIVPVSDPNITSAQQRVGQANAVLELTKLAPHQYDIKEVHRRVLEALRVPEIDGILIDKDKAIPLDQVTENVLMMMGKPVRVYEWQDHASHIAVMDAFMQSDMVSQVPPEMAEMLKPVFDAHKLEHLAMMYREQFVAQMGGMPPVDMYADGKEAPAQALDPQIERQITQMAAQMVLQQQPQQIAPPKTPEQMAEEGKQVAAQAEQGRQDAKFKQLEQQKAAAFGAEQQRKDVELKGSMGREQQLHDQELQNTAEENAVDMAKQKDQAVLDQQNRTREAVKNVLAKKGPRT